MEQKNERRELVIQLSKLNSELRKLELEVIEIEENLSKKKEQLELSRRSKV